MSVPAPSYSKLSVIARFGGRKTARNRTEARTCIAPRGLLFSRATCRGGPQAARQGWQLHRREQEKQLRAHPR